METGTLPSLQWVERPLSQQALPKPLRKRKEVSNVPTEAAAVVGEEEEVEEVEEAEEEEGKSRSHENTQKKKQFSFFFSFLFSREKLCEKSF